MPKGKKKEHEWDYMGWDTEKNVEYSWCHLCNKYQHNGNGYVTISKKEYLSRVESGKVKFQ